jgi:serine/threonine protein kinase
MRRHGNQSERYEKRVGTTVDGRWRIDELLGVGSTSAVYGATHRNGHRAALKIIHPSLCADPALIQRFLREAGLANAIKHRAIVPIGDDGITEDRCAYLVLELLHGETLDEMRERGHGRISLEELAPIADELMSAIVAVHAAGVVHRDLKPGNIFITTAPPGAPAGARGRLKLLDFGTARIFDREMDSTLSAAGLVMGTPAYMSPEQARGARAEVDAQSDVWSLGAMIFALLTGEHVHVGRDAHQQLLMAAMRPARFVSTADRSVDHRVAAAIDGALAYAKKDRWPDVRTFRTAFRKAVVASAPSMHDLEAFVEVGSGTPADGTASILADDTVRDVSGLADDNSSPRLVSFSSDPTIVMTRGSVAPPDGAAGDAAARATPFASAVPIDVGAAPRPESMSAVTSTHGARRGAGGIPLVALVLGTAAMAAAIVLVVFFMSGGDEARPQPAAAAATQSPGPAETASVSVVMTTGPSFIEITAPDVPVTTKQASAAVAKPAPARVAPSKTTAAKDAGATSNAESAPAEGSATSAPPAEDPPSSP